MRPHTCPHRPAKLTVWDRLLPVAMSVDILAKKAQQFELIYHSVSPHRRTSNWTHISSKQRVAGSSPAAPTNFLGIIHCKKVTYQKQRNFGESGGMPQKAQMLTFVGRKWAESFLPCGASPRAKWAIRRSEGLLPVPP